MRAARAGASVSSRQRSSGERPSTRIPSPAWRNCQAILAPRLQVSESRGVSAPGDDLRGPARARRKRSSRRRSVRRARPERRPGFAGVLDQALHRPYRCAHAGLEENPMRSPGFAWAGSAQTQAAIHLQDLAGDEIRGRQEVHDCGGDFRARAGLPAGVARAMPEFGAGRLVEAGSRGATELTVMAGARALARTRVKATTPALEAQ